MDEFFQTHRSPDDVENNDSKSNEADMQNNVDGLEDGNNDASEIFKVTCSVEMLEKNVLRLIIGNIIYIYIYIYIYEYICLNCR